MSKGAIKAIVFPIVFIVALIIFSIVTNHTNEDLTRKMADAKLPVVYLNYDDEELNELYGYTQEMDATCMRDTITPIESTRVLPITIQTYNLDIDAISYEIRSMDTERLISNADITDYSQQKGVLNADLEIQNLLEEGEEYQLILKLESGEQSIYYYTRIIEPADCYVSESLAFVQNFHDTTFNSETSSTLATYVEPNDSGDNSTLQTVTINSSLSQITWADFAGDKLTDPVPSIKEINSSYNVIGMNYIMTTTGTNGELEYYNVEETYRVRYTNDRMYLLNYNRTMNQIFRGENNSFYDNYIQLGVRDGDIQYKTNESGNIVCFVQEGELWSYNETESELSQVFSFRGYEGIEDRENNSNHEIKIIKVDESGSADFVVYGYMNRGIHEGQVGICVYHYDSIANTIEEELFIPSDKAAEVMKADMGQLMYESESNAFYIIMDGTIYGIDLNSLKATEIVTGLTEGSYEVSDSNQYVAYIDNKDSNAGTLIHVLDLETQEDYEINAASDEYIRPLGFMNNDFIYGSAKRTNVICDEAGNTAFPMDQVQIVDTEDKNHEVLKEYHKDGYYVSDIEISGYTIYLNRIQYNGAAYIPTTQDTIMSREGDNSEVVTTHSTVTEQKETQMQLELNSLESITATKLLTPKEIVLEEDRSLALEENKSATSYYAYAQGKVIKTTSNVSQAISAANDSMGIVVDEQQNYIWKRAKKTQQSAISVSIEATDAGSNSIAKSISALLGAENIHVSVQALLDQGNTPKEILTDTMQDMEVLDLSGCDLEEVLYYVDNGTPVFAMLSSSEAVLIVGYDANNIIIFDPALNSTYKKSISDSTNLFTQAGNIFFGYLK